MLLCSILVGPVQRGQRPSSPLRQDQSDPLNLDAVLVDGMGWEAILAQNLDIQVSRNASLMAPIAITWRGSRSQQLQWDIDGVALGDALGGGGALRSLDPGLFQAARLYDASSEGLDAPIAGGLSLSSPTRGFSAAVNTDSLQGFGVRLRHATAKRSLSFSSQNHPGDFTYLNTRGTNYNTSDDGWDRRRNNDAARAGLLWRQRLTQRLQLHLVATHLNGGISGSADRPLLAVREREALQLMHLRWRLTTAPHRQWLDASLMTRQTRLTDPGAELTGLDGLEPISEQARLTLQWRYKKLSNWGGFEGRGRLLLDQIQRRPNPLHAAAQGERFGGRIGASIRLGASTRWHGLAWVSAGQRIDALDDLIAQLPEALQNTTTSNNAPDWAPGLSLAFASKIRLRLLAGLRQPSMLERVGQHGGLRGNPTLKPEQGWTVDGRLRHDMSAVQLQLDLYHRQSTDLIDWSATSFGRAMPINRALVDLTGAQFMARFKRASWSLQGAYRWQGEWAKDSADDRESKRLAGSAEHRGRVIAWYRRHTWRFGAGLMMQSQRFLDAANSRAIRARPEVNLILAHRATKAIDLRLQLMNALDHQTVALHLLPNNHSAVVARQDRWGQVLPGRRLELSLQVKDF